MLEAVSENDWSKVNLEGATPKLMAAIPGGYEFTPDLVGCSHSDLAAIKGREPTLDRGQSRLASDIAGMISERADFGWRSLHAFARNTLWNRSSSKMRKRLTS